MPSVKTILLWCLLLTLSHDFVGAAAVRAAGPHPIHQLVGEVLTYDISFLWFDRLAEGTIALYQEPEPDTFRVIMEARTLGVAAWLTRHRVEKFQTRMRLGRDGLLHPLEHSSHSIRGTGKARREKISRYSYDAENLQVRYQKSKNGRVYAEQLLELEPDRPVFDILSALYNLRLGLYGQVGKEQIIIPTFRTEGYQEIVVEPLIGVDQRDRQFLSEIPLLCRILVDPEVFGTKGRDILAGFDANGQPIKGIIKNVIGLGDVRGTLRTDLYPES